MATILTKTFDTSHGAVFISVQDAILGNVAPHTIYALKPDGTPNDVTAEINTILANADTQAAALKAALEGAGWTGGV